MILRLDTNNMLDKKLNYNLFVVILRYNVPLENIDILRGAHLEFLQKYYNENLFIVSGPQVPRNGGIIVAKCENKERLCEILANDPFAINNSATYEFIEFTPTKWLSQFEDI